MAVRKKKKEKKMIHYFDYSLLAVVIFLLCFGLVMLYSTSFYSAQLKFDDGMRFFKQQLKASVLGMVVMWILAKKVNYHGYIRKAKMLYIVSFVLMGLVWSPIGVEAYGARRWIQIPLLGQMQPAEATKIAVILYIPYLICRNQSKLKTLKGCWDVFKWGIFAAAGVFLITDNLSSAIIVVGICAVLFVIVYPKSKPIVMAASAIGIVGYAGIRMMGGVLEKMGGFRMQRILTWLNPELYEDDGGLQVIQGLYAIGSGGFFGKGLGNSIQKTIIPEAQNDMILSIICEELGVFGALILLIIFGILLYRLLFIAQNAPDLYGGLVVTGIFAHIAIQVVLNICVVLNLIPTTGITLPFVSYGGTTIVFLLAEIGIALGVSQRIKFEE